VTTADATASRISPDRKPEEEKLTVRNAVKRLEILHAAWARLFGVTASWIARTPGTELKCTLGRLLYQDTQAIDAIRTRLTELRGSPDSRAWVAAVTKAGNEAGDFTAEVDLVGTRLGWQAAIRHAVEQYERLADPLWDEPGSVLIRALTENLAQSDALLRTRWAGAVSTPAVIEDLVRLLASAIGDPGQDLPAGMKDKPLVTTKVAARDPALTVVSPADMKGADVPPDESLIYILHTIAFCVEIAAVDVCSQMIAAHPELPWECHRDLARQVCDEVRHYELLRRRVEQLGGSMGKYPVHTGVWDYSQLGDSALEQLCLQQVIQEGHGLDADVVFSNHMAKQGDTETAVMFDFVGADEVNHIRLGCRWMLYLADGDPELVWEAFEQGYQRLIDHDYKPKYPVQEHERSIAGMSPRQIAKAREVVAAMIGKQLAELAGQRDHKITAG
jgi:uncharacterized ferritin-like protein (DUF455 family)